MNLELDGKRAFVTGSTAGIGYAIAQALAQEGANVIVNGRTEERVEQAIRAILDSHPQAKVEGLAANLGSAPESVSRFNDSPTSIFSSITWVFSIPDRLSRFLTKSGFVFLKSM